MDVAAFDEGGLPGALFMSIVACANFVSALSPRREGAPTVWTQINVRSCRPADKPKALFPHAVVNGPKGSRGRAAARRQGRIPTPPRSCTRRGMGARCEGPARTGHEASGNGFAPGGGGRLARVMRRRGMGLRRGGGGRLARVMRRRGVGLRWGVGAGSHGS